MRCHCVHLVIEARGDIGQRLLQCVGVCIPIAFGGFHAMPRRPCTTLGGLALRLLDIPLAFGGGGTGEGFISVMRIGNNVSLLCVQVTNHADSDRERLPLRGVALVRLTLDDGAQQLLLGLQLGDAGVQGGSALGFVMRA